MSNSESIDLPVYESTNLPESDVVRDVRGRVTHYYGTTQNGERICVPVPERYTREYLTYVGDNWLQMLAPFLRKQAE